MSFYTSRSPNWQKRQFWKPESSCQTTHGDLDLGESKVSQGKSERLNRLTKEAEWSPTLTLHRDNQGALFVSFGGLRYGIQSREEIQIIVADILKKMDENKLYANVGAGSVKDS
jgi:hypothetical protein